MKTNLIAGAVVAVLAVGRPCPRAGTRSGTPAPSPAAPAGAPAKGPGGPPAGIAVEAQRPTPMRLPQSLTTVGSLRSEETVIVRPEIAGRVALLAFREGHRVTKGDVLVRLDDSVQKADLERARANLVLSKSKFERAEDLRARVSSPGRRATRRRTLSRSRRATPNWQPPAWRKPRSAPPSAAPRAFAP